MSNQQKPVLVFRYDRAVGWQLKNLGPGAALDILVAEKSFREQNWQRPVSAEFLAQGEHKELCWLRHRNIDTLGARYQNSEGARFFSLCFDDRSTTGAPDSFPNWGETEIDREWIIRTKGDEPGRQAPVAQFKEKTPPLLEALRRVLTELYPGRNEAVVVARDIQLGVACIDLNGSADTVWSNILEKAQKSNKVPELVNRCLRDYRGNSELQHLAGLLR